MQTSTIFLDLDLAQDILDPKQKDLIVARATYGFHKWIKLWGKDLSSKVDDNSCPLCFNCWSHCFGKENDYNYCSYRLPLYIFIIRVLGMTSTPKTCRLDLNHRGWIYTKAFHKIGRTQIKVVDHPLFVIYIQIVSFCVGLCRFYSHGQWAILL